MKDELFNMEIFILAHELTDIKLPIEPGWSPINVQYASMEALKVSSRYGAKLDSDEIDAIVTIMKSRVDVVMKSKATIKFLTRHIAEDYINWKVKE